MRLVSFESGSQSRIGCVTADSVVALDVLGPSMVDLIANWEERRAEAERMVNEGARIPLSSVKLSAPISRPGKVFAIGLNYSDHIAETGREPPQHQLWFSKASTAINGPFDPIVIPKVAKKSVDYEGELVAVIGATIRHASIEGARDSVFGYCCGNDVSVREWQRHTPQWTLGKSFDTHAPIGPWIITADQIRDPHALDIRCLVNGEIRQQSNTRHLLFSVWDQIQHLSKAMTLEPGDLIFTGTPGGVGSAMRPPQFLRCGDRVTVEIEGIGRIQSEMIAEE